MRVGPNPPPNCSLDTRPAPDVPVSVGPRCSAMAIAKHWPLAAALVVLTAVLGACLALSLKRNDGHLTYVLDDPYIHMAVARNLSEHGVFGVTRYGYSSSTSSILWPLLLSAVYLMTGPNAITPGVLGVLFAVAALGLMYFLLERRGVPPWLNFVYLMIIALCTPLPAIIFTGMEHSLHVLLTVAYLYLAAAVLSPDRDAQRTSPGRLRALLFAMGPLIAMTRYEGALMVAAVCLMFAARRRLRDAAVMAGLGAVPILVNGLVSLAHGWHFLPNPVLLKGRISTSTLLGEKALALIRDPATLVLAAAVLLVAAAVCLRSRRPGKDGKDSRSGRRISPATGLVLVAAVAALLAVDVAQSWNQITRSWDDPHWDLRWAYVHEIYLVPAGLVATALVLVLLYRRDGWSWTANKTMLWIFLITALLHLGLARRGWFWRYEAYLVAGGLFVVLLVAYEEFFQGIRLAALRKHLAWCGAVGLLAVPFAVRGVRSLIEIPRASMNIYDQQYQMASFLSRYYTGRGVAANDVGAINYYADIRCLDLWGLCDLRVAAARLAGDCGPETVHALAADNGVGIAVVFDKWCQEEFGGVPRRWQKVGEWGIVDNLVCGWYVVSFYAVDPRERDALAENLSDYSSQLPDRVTERGAYLESKGHRSLLRHYPGGRSERMMAERIARVVK